MTTPDDDVAVPVRIRIIRIGDREEFSDVSGRRFGPSPSLLSEAFKDALVASQGVLEARLELLVFTAPFDVFRNGGANRFSHGNSVGLGDGVEGFSLI